MPGPGRILSPTVTATHLTRRRAGPPVVRRFTTNREAEAAADRIGSGIAALLGGAHGPRTCIPASLSESPCLAANARTLRIRTSLSRATESPRSRLARVVAAGPPFRDARLQHRRPRAAGRPLLCAAARPGGPGRGPISGARKALLRASRAPADGQDVRPVCPARLAQRRERGPVPLRLHQRRDRADSARGRGTGDGCDRLRDREGSQKHAV